VQTSKPMVLGLLECYCHFQNHTIGISTFHSTCSKCRSCTVKHDAALLVLWYLEWSNCKNTAPLDTCL